ncbi:hypothetical protein ACXR6G_06415 [Ancylomarina sp. YFZ004]
MASRRKLKKDIDFLTFEVISDCYNYIYLHPGNEEKVLEVIKETVANRNNLVARTNHPDGKDNAKLVKEHYKAVFKELIDNTDASFTKLSELIKA